MVWQREIATLVEERLVVSNFGGISRENVEDLLQWYAVDHVIVCSCPGRDMHVTVAVRAIAACSHVSVHLAPLELESPTNLRSVLKQARVYMRRALDDELGGSTLVACGSGASFSVAIVLAFLVGDCGRSLEDAFRTIAKQRWCIWPSALLVSELLQLESCVRTEAGKTPLSQDDLRSARQLIGTHGAWAKAKHAGCECSWQAAEAAWEAVSGHFSLECAFAHCTNKLLKSGKQLASSDQRPAKRLRCGPRLGSESSNEVLSCVDVQLGTTFTVVEFGYLANSMCFPSECGHILWPAGHALAMALAKDTLLPPGRLEGKIVLELGAGIGLPGLVAARKGAKQVWLTDRLSVIDLTARNAAVNGLADTVYCTELDWLEPLGSDAVRRHFDIVLATDVVYADEMAAFAHALVALMRVDTVLLLGYTQRPNCREFLESQVPSLFADVSRVLCRAADVGCTECEVFILSGFTGKAQGVSERSDPGSKSIVG